MPNMWCNVIWHHTMISWYECTYVNQHDGFGPAPWLHVHSHALLLQNSPVLQLDTLADVASRIQHHDNDDDVVEHKYDDKVYTYNATYDWICMLIWMDECAYVCIHVFMYYIDRKTLLQLLITSSITTTPTTTPTTPDKGGNSTKLCIQSLNRQDVNSVHHLIPVAMYEGK